MTFPSPQISTQVLELLESPKLQLQSLSIAQEESHPSSSTVFPSSQYPAVGLITIPSPHVSVQILAVEESPSVQVQPVSTAQLESQPSFDVVPPSSQ